MTVDKKNQSSDENEKFINNDHEVKETNKPAIVESKGMELLYALPIDRYKLVYLIFLWHGLSTLMPWNMFITATSYFTDYKLASNDTQVKDYRMYWLSFLGITAQIPGVTLTGMNLFFQCGNGSNIGRRIIWSILIVILTFAVTVIFAMIDTSSWTITFFWITMVSVVIMNSANGMYQSSLYGLAACLPMKYTNAIILGNNISGTVTAILSIISKVSSPNERTAAIYYFLSAIFVLLIAFDTYFILPFIKFYRHYEVRAAKERQAEIDKIGSSTPPYFHIFKKCWVHLLSVWFVFFVTLTIFPAIQADVLPISDDFFIHKDYFSGITCFLFFNLFAMFGNLATEVLKVPGPKYVWIPVVLRLLFIPFFMFCNFKPDDRSIPVYISNDYVFIIGGIFMAFTSGYFSSLCMMYAPRNVEPKYQNTAGIMASFFLLMGIFSGVIFSIPVQWLINNAGR